MITVKLTDAERALLNKRAKKADMSVADYLRMTMVLEAVMAGDLDAVKILAENVRGKLVRSFSGMQDVPVKA
jgi:hypothetical protein